MNTQTKPAPVDVLAVMGAAAVAAFYSSEQAARELREARAAVAELIAAAKLSCSVDRVTDGLRAALARVQP